MRAPVRQFTTRICMPIPEGVMAVAIQRHATTITLPHFRKRPVCDFGCRAKPHIPVQFRWYRCFRNHGRRTKPTNSASHFLDLSDASRSYQCNCLEKSLPRFGSLHGPHLKRTPRFLYDLLDQFAFSNCQRKRLFTINILAGQHRLDGNFGMPVIRSRNHDCINVFAVQNSSVITIGVRFLALTFF